MNYLNSNTTTSCQLQLEAFNLIEALFCEVNPIPVKKAVSLMGFGTSYLRSPLYEIETENEKRLTQAMKDYHLLV